MTTATSPTSSSSTAAIELDDSQRRAVDEVSRWLEARLVDPKVPQIFRIGGYAGSGKTTIIPTRPPQPRIRLIRHEPRKEIDIDYGYEPDEQLVDGCD